jgi:dolichol-phosphate mannosyltransferase
MKLSIIIPVYNEEKTIEEILRQVSAVKLPGVDREIIVVDDSSNDKSKEKIQNIQLKGIKLIIHKENQGKGAAVVTGIKKSKGDIILIQDADLEYDPNDYPKLLKPIMSGKAEVVYGSRLKNYPLRFTGKKKTPLITHYLGNRFLTFITNVLYGNDLSDMETCYKVFRREVVKGIEIKAKRFDFEPEFTAKIMKRGIKIHEVPIKVKPRGYDEGKKITWKDGFIAVWTLLKYRFVD